ncbi:ComEC/Rec2 family competence protein [Halocatena marina]|uniref:ComEC/Rec2 family competence protein n=1 Tax=Halocatena marina TaxID=2934937 RepID=A0ABD5YUY0_9EURY
MPDEPLANGRREVYTLDVDQADSHAIITEDGDITLIDADKEAVVDELDTIIAGRTTPQTDTKNIPIETFVLTHIHDDHVRGVGALHDHGYEIQNVVEPAEHRYEERDPDTGKPRKGVKEAVLETYLYELEQHGIETIKQVSVGDFLTSDYDNQVVAPPHESGKLEFTSPATGRKNTLKATGANANSIAFKTEGEQSMLFMGDVEDTGGLNGESWLMHQHDSDENDVDLNADVLILAHHGSNNATSGEFLDRVDPDITVISSGLHNKHTSTNEHDAHPHDATLKRLHDREIDVYWTPGHGSLHTDLDSESAHPEPTTDLETTSAADVAALKYYCREHDVSPEQIVALTPDHLPEETPAWVADAAPMMVESTEEILDEAIANGESVEDLRQTLDPTPDAHDQLKKSVQADRDEHVTTRADVNRNREAFFSAKRAEDAYKRLPLHTRLRANLPNRFGGSSTRYQTFLHPTKSMGPARSRRSHEPFNIPPQPKNATREESSSTNSS